MSQQEKVVIPVENKRRELTGKLFLALELVSRNYCVYLGSNDIHNNIKDIKPDVYFELSAVSREERVSRVRRLKQCDVTTLVLDTEGGAFGNADDFRPRVSEEVLTYTDCYCAWGRKAARIASEEASEASIRIETTGNPRFDVLQDRYNQVYQAEAEKIRNSYDNFILVNTNFSINHVDPNHVQNSALGKLETIFKKQSKLIGEFLSAVGTLADEFTDHNVIVRPHPSEDSSLYQQLFAPYSNVHVDNSGEVRPWILASNAVIHNSCTTGVTSALLGTPVFAYLPQDISTSLTPNQVSVRCQSLPELINKIGSVIKNTTAYEMDQKQIEQLKPYIDNINTLSVNRIGDIIDSIDHKETAGFSQTFSPDFRHQAKTALVKLLGSNKIGPIYYQRLRGRGSVSYKFPKTTLREIGCIVKSLSDEINCKTIKIDTIPGVVYGYKLWASKD